MDEENKAEEKPEEKPTPTEDKGVQSKAISELDRADQIAERLKRENDRKDELLTREEALAARRAVGGIAEAGQTPVKKTKEEAKTTDAKEFFKGTALEKDIEKANE